MGRSCAVIKCNSSSRFPERKFFRFPLLNKTNYKALSLTQTRQDAWLTALNRANFFSNHYQYASVCDLHFVSGKSAKYTDVDNVDWVPKLNLGYQIKIEFDKQEESEQSDVPDVLTSNEDFNTKETQDKSTQTDETYTGLSPDIVISHQEKVAFLEEMLNSKNVDLDRFRDDKKTKFFTGISNFVTLEAVFELLEPKIKCTRKLTKFQIMFLVLTRLRLNLSFRYLSYQFDVSIPTISKHFHSCLLIMHSKLKNLVYWPERDAIKKTMPLSFQMFGDTIVVIIDCFELFIETPSNIKAAAQCWSSYKHATTIKYLIGITPQGFISYISKGYGGRSSDKFITENSDFLDNLSTGDVVMADRGFLIEEVLKNRGVELQIPAFTKGKSQLHPLEIEATRKIANVRIHVERVIGQLRQKFTILHQFKYPISLITKKSTSSVSTIDQIVTVCCALSNICAPVVCKEEADCQRPKQEDGSQGPKEENGSQRASE